MSSLTTVQPQQLYSNVLDNKSLDISKYIEQPNHQTQPDLMKKLNRVDLIAHLSKVQHLESNFRVLGANGLSLKTMVPFCQHGF